MIEMKITIAKMLSAYRVVDTPDTQLDIANGDQFLLAYPNMKVKLEKR